LLFAGGFGGLLVGCFTLGAGGFGGAGFFGLARLVGGLRGLSLAFAFGLLLAD
jgi:hypothetical protein